VGKKYEKLTQHWILILILQLKKVKRWVPTEKEWEVWIPCLPPPHSIQKSKIHTRDLKKGNAL